MKILIHDYPLLHFSTICYGKSLSSGIHHRGLYYFLIRWSTFIQYSAKHIMRAQHMEGK